MKAIWEQLSDEEAETLKSMKDAGASKEEIKDYLEGLGIDLPEKPRFDQGR